MKNTSTKDRKEYLKRYRGKNKEKIAEYKREYRQENKEKIAEKNKKYREENKEKILEHIRNYYQENKEKRQNKHNNKCNMDCLNCIYDDCIMS